jgi:hypothetical protein
VVLRPDLVRIIGTLVAFSLAVSANAAERFPEYPVRPASEYAVKADWAGLTVALEPVEDRREQETYFRTKLAPKGYVPVFLVMDNGSQTDSFLFDKTHIKYGVGVAIDSGPDAHSKAGEMVGAASLGAMSLAGALTAVKLIANATHIQQNMLKREVQSKTLSPGGSLHGFVYVPAPSKGEREPIHLHVLVGKAGTGETFTFDLVF